MKIANHAILLGYIHKDKYLFGENAYVIPTG